MKDQLAKDLYLELLKKTILFEIWLEHEQGADPEQRRQGIDWPAVAHSMIGRLRMDHLHTCMTSVVADAIEGDFIETGVWRGGACIFMRGFLKVNGIQDRRVWLADSFAGLPPPDVEYPVDQASVFHTYDFLKVSLEQVQANFQKYDLLDEKVCFLKGWFKDTLPAAPIDKIAIARLDGDMYSSTIESLTSLYPKVTRGGYIIIDDFFLIGNCAMAVADFRTEYGITDPLLPIDSVGVYWRKS